MHVPPYRQIPLHRRDGSIAAHALIDEVDAHLAEGRRWHVGSNGYARHNGALAEGHQVVYLMHRMVLGLASGDERQADHISRDRFDNRRANLRIVTHDENMQNRPSHRNSSSRFRAVYWETARGNRKATWVAQARLNGRKHWIGRFASEIEAGLAAEEWRRQHMPYATPDPELVALSKDALTNNPSTP